MEVLVGITRFELIFFLDQQQQQGYGQPPQPGFYPPPPQGQAGYPPQSYYPNQPPPTNPNYYPHPPTTTAQPMFQDPNNNFSNDAEVGGVDARFDFDDQSVRKAFIRKVYMILMVSDAIHDGYCVQMYKLN